MRSRRILSAVLAAIAAMPLPALSADLRVDVTGLRNSAGEILVAVCPEALFLDPACPYRERVPAADSGLTFSDIPPGDYAVQAFHDEYANGELDRRAFFRPLEGLGFSRDARMRFGPPDFRDAAVRIREPGGRVAVRMRYYP
ncbi:DUF2141 domain-containing protein [Tranquillimonas alkanivorans]|uniref:Uncharacterized conserved protein, DUF2141 family n=1 Tax=Tranquillimonas alkanivorans TaxID=441119 RepID=A0A1I5PN65_9RHOB|nr:DUF2141 domain-containing protein [Tranquillimonas alkanivorans]SFP35493.1 Uncharacterized conserved protein, DUF2141 family [Tranquillimonas alkanivorans]